MNGAEAVAEVLRSEAYERVWSFPGGTISPLLDAVDRAGIDIFIARNEAGAGHMAQAAWRVMGIPQIVLVTSGPGVTNVLTAVADAYFDSDAVVFLTGQVSTDSLREDLPVRQRGFQEIDTVALMRPIVKCVKQPLIPDALPGCVSEAIKMSQRGRPGPWAVDCPMDVQRGEVKYFYPGGRGLPRISASPRIVNEAGVAKAIDQIIASQRPLVIAGRGCLGSQNILRHFIRKYRLRAVVSLPAVGVVPSDWPENLGILGHTGHERANIAIAEADCLIVLGSRLDVRQTGTEVDAWAAEKTVIRVDFDPDELAHSRIRVDMAFSCDVRLWLETAFDFLR